MAIIFLNGAQETQPGDILLTRLNFKDPGLLVHGVVAAFTRSRFVHGTMVTHKRQDFKKLEWSVGPLGPHLRPEALDVECWAYRINHPYAKEIGLKASRWLIDRLPKTPKRYDWEGAGFVGIQALVGVQKRQPWKNIVPYCFEGVTDAYWQIGYDIVPWVDPGAILGADIDESTRKVPEGFDSPLLYRL